MNAVVALRVAAMSALRSSPYGIGFETSRGGASARASASTARVWRRTPAELERPAGQLHDECACRLGRSWFCQEMAVPW